MALLTCTEWSKLFTIRMTRPALRFIEPEVVDRVPRSASMMDGLRLAGFEPHP